MGSCTYPHRPAGGALTHIALQAGGGALVVALDVGSHLLAGWGGVAALQAPVAPPGVLPENAATERLA